MAYIVQQLRKVSDPNTYMIPLANLSLTEIDSPDQFGQMEEGRIATRKDLGISGNFQLGKVYYFRFRVHKIPQYFYSGSVQQSVGFYTNNDDTLSISLILKNEEDVDQEQTPPEVIGSFIVNPAYRPDSGGYQDEYSSFAFVFSPSKTFNQLGFRVNRTKFDAIEGNRSWLLDQFTYASNPSKLDIDVPASENKYFENHGTPIDMKTTGARIDWEAAGENSDFCQLVNIIPNGQKWLKFGYQSRPGNLIVVNNQPIIVGRSGIYEIDNGTKINSFMIAAPNRQIDAFLLDYAYLTQSNNG